MYGKGVGIGRISEFLGLDRKTVRRYLRATHWDEVVVSLGYEYLRRHDLRHTGLTWFADAGVPIHVLQKIAGHGHITTTQRYLHPDKSSIEKAGRTSAGTCRRTGALRRRHPPARLRRRPECVTCASSIERSTVHAHLHGPRTARRWRRPRRSVSPVPSWSLTRSQEGAAPAVDHLAVHQQKSRRPGISPSQWPSDILSGRQDLNLRPLDPQIAS
ncbi:hypothetical protein GCM10010441_43530 [Kitasatospora paracochleata]